MIEKEITAHESQLLAARSRLDELTSPKEVLKEICELLEEFGPVWYTEELHRRATAALKVN